MTHEIRNRIVREATPEEKERHRAIREGVEQDLEARGLKVLVVRERLGEAQPTHHLK